MSSYEVIFGLDCVGGDQAPIDCAIVKASNGKPGIMLDGEVFTKDSLTPAPVQIPVILMGELGGNSVSVKNADTTDAADISPTEDIEIYFVDKDAVVSVTSGGAKPSYKDYLTLYAIAADGTPTIVINDLNDGSYTVTGSEKCLYGSIENK